MITRKCEHCDNTYILVSGQPPKACKACYKFRRKAVNLLYAAKHRAEKRNLSFDLTLQWIIDRLKEPCPMTGVDFDLIVKGNNYLTRSPYSPSIDRIDPAKGYTTNNCRLVCWWYNVSKQQFTDEETIKFCRLVHDKNISITVH